MRGGSGRRLESEEVMLHLCVGEVENILAMMVRGSPDQHYDTTPLKNYTIAKPGEISTKNRKRTHQIYPT